MSDRPAVRRGRLLLAALFVVALALPAIPLVAQTGTSPTGQSAALAPAAVPQIQWEQVHSLPLSYYTVFFATRDLGFALAGRDWNDPVRGPATLSRTTDGGKTWTDKVLTDGTTQTNHWMRGLACKDATTCWISGASVGRIMRTTDGGNTWKYMLNQSTYGGWLWSMAYTGNGSTALAGTTCYDAADPKASANFLRATDGYAFQGVGQNGCVVQWDIDCPVSGTCLSGAKGNAVYRTVNNGANWQRIQAVPFPGGSRSGYRGVSCVDAQSCWISGDHGQIEYSNNGGTSWTPQLYAGTDALLWDVDMLSAQQGYAVGCDRIEPVTDKCLGSGVIYRTDNGQNWEKANSPTTAALMDLWVFGMDDLFAVDWSGKIWHGTLAPPDTPTPTATATVTVTPTPSTGTVLGVAFADTDADGHRDGGETGLAGAEIALRQDGVEVSAAVSDQNGEFTFTGIQPGQYLVVEKSAPPGYALSPAAIGFEIGANQGYTFYLGHQVLPPTPTATPTAEPTETPTPSPTATATQPITFGFLPLFMQP